MMSGLCIELVVAQIAFAGQQSKCAGLDDGVPIARFCADRAVTFVCAQVQVDVGFKSNGAAMTASNKGFDHHNLPKENPSALIYRLSHSQSDHSPICQAESHARFGNRGGPMTMPRTAAVWTDEAQPSLGCGPS
jgi:hypothetical protein